MYGIAGERYLPERELTWLSGYEDSKPVRIGNAASEQLQLDIYGEVLGAFHQALGRLGKDGELSFSMLRHLVEHLETIWQQPDEGIWETRGGRKHFTYSKMMAWVAFDRAIKAAGMLHAGAPVERWQKVRTKIHDEICSQAYNEKLGSFVQSYGSDHLDASLLLMPMTGFLPADGSAGQGHPEGDRGQQLMSGGWCCATTPRRSSDGLPPGEGVFLACSFWMVRALQLQGRDADARKLFERVLSLANDVGLLAEEYDHRGQAPGRKLPPGAFAYRAGKCCLQPGRFRRAISIEVGFFLHPTGKSHSYSYQGVAKLFRAWTPKRKDRRRNGMHVFEVWAPYARTMEVKIGDERFAMAGKGRGWWSAKWPRQGRAPTMGS
jgi:GH15 family glucan-1,4-alpha-glucosidase